MYKKTQELVDQLRFLANVHPFYVDCGFGQTFRGEKAQNLIEVRIGIKPFSNKIRRRRRTKIHTSHGFIPGYKTEVYKTLSIYEKELIVEMISEIAKRLVLKIPKELSLEALKPDEYEGILAYRFELPQ